MILLLITCAGGKKAEKKDGVMSIEEHFRLGFDAAGRGNLEEAVSEYKEVLRLDPKNSRAHLNLGIVYGRQGKLGEEISEYKKAIAYRPAIRRGLFQLRGFLQ